MMAGLLLATLPSLTALTTSSGPRTATSLLSRPFGELATLAGSDSSARFLWRSLRKGDDPTAAWDIDAAGRHGLGASRRTFIEKLHMPLEKIAPCEIVAGLRAHVEKARVVAPWFPHGAL